MLTRGDISSISSAAHTREALMQVRSRESGLESIQSRAPGARYKLESTAQKIPITDQTGQAFAGPLLHQDQALMIPQDIQTGNVIEYQDKATGTYHYGQVIQNNAKKKRVEVKTISKHEAEEITSGNLKTRIYSLNDSDIGKHEMSNGMSTLMSLLDPSENIVFKLIMLLLVGNIFKSESITDVFMSVYIRVIVLALSIIGITYISTTFF